MKIKSLTLISSFIALASAGIGNINSFSRYPGIVKLIKDNTKNYKSNFKYTFKDGPIYSGTGTAYGNAKNGGNCLFPKKEYYNDMMYAALNNDQYNLDMGCGLCAVVVSDSNPYKAIRVRIIDQCPECAHGSLDFSDKAFKALTNQSPGIIKITWALIPCDVKVNEYPALVRKNSNIKFQFKTGSTAFWTEVQVFNTRYPVARVQLLKNGKYVSLRRQRYNYWALPSGGFGAGPFTFKVTLADGSVIVARKVKMVIPLEDEGAAFSTGIQTKTQGKKTTKKAATHKKATSNNKKAKKVSNKKSSKKVTKKVNKNTKKKINNKPSNKRVIKATRKVILRKPKKY